MSIEDDALDTGAAESASDAASTASTVADAAASGAGLAQSMASGDPSAMASSALNDGVGGATQLASALGAPDVPSMPEVPGVPDVPDVPDVPSMPDVPGVPSLPNVPGVPNVPSLPGVPGAPELPSAPSMPGMPGGRSIPGPASAPSIVSTIATTVASVAPSIADYANIGSSIARHIQEALSGDEVHQVYVRFEASTDPAYEWVVGSFTLKERIGGTYFANVEIGTDAEAVDPTALLGKSCSLSFERGDLEHRLCGIVESVSTSVNERAANVVVVPALAFGALRRNTRIFQNQSVRQILEALLPEILGPYGRTASFDGLSRTYPTCEYRTQYDETDLDFIHRLMEEEGIFYWFDHTGDAEELLLVDHASSHPDVESSNGAEVEFTHYGSDGMTADEVVRTFVARAAMRSTALRTWHYDWTKAGSRLEADQGCRIEGEFVPEEPAEDDPPHGAVSGPEREVFEHDDAPLTLSEYDEGQHAYQQSDVDDQVRIRREAMARDARTAAGSSTVIGFTAGAIFELIGHPQAALDGRWLLTSVTHTYAAGGGEAYTNDFECQPADTPFRLERGRRKPQVFGIQTATVVGGPSGAEIDTDFHGRVKVHFHWDREGERDEHSSCYLRVMQPWAGQGWGFLFLPRIGMEVVVGFIAGDPDRPVVTGTLYNGENRIQTNGADVFDPAVSFIRTQSTPSAEGFNELKFDDNQGAEQVYIHAQKDFVEEVLNDHDTTVTRNQSNSVDGSHTETVGGDQTLSVTGKRTKTVKKDETNTVEGARTHEITGAETVTLKNKRTTTIDQTDELTVTGKRKATLNGGREVTVDSFDTLTVNGGNRTTTVHGKYTLSSDEQIKLEQGGAHFLRLDGLAQLGTTGDFKVFNNSVSMETTGGALAINASDSVTITCGSASITMTSDGTIEIAGSTLVKMGCGGNAVQADTSGVTASGGAMTISGSDVTIAGSVVKIN